MATTRDLLNEVLVGLRKDEIGSGVNAVTSAYHKLLLQFINTAKEEVEEAWDWQVLRKTITVTGVAAQAAYTMDSAGAGDIDLNPRSKLLYEKTSPGGIITENTRYSAGDRPQMWDTTATTTPRYRMRELAFEHLQRLAITDDDTTAEQPLWFALTRDPDDLIIHIQQPPTGVRQWMGRFLAPQDKLTATDITTILDVPQRPVWILALAKANLERGEEIGRPGTDPFDDANVALANAIAVEQTDDDITGYPV